MAPHSSTLAWKIPWMEEPGRLQSMGSLGVGHDWLDLAAAADFKYVGSFLRPGIAMFEAETSNRNALILSSFFSIFFLSYSFSFPSFSWMVTSVNSTIFEPITLNRDALSYQPCPSLCLGLANKSHLERASPVPALLCLFSYKKEIWSSHISLFVEKVTLITE